jgi:pimeloyl-ACP methyl ester carboxylesterase
MKQLSKFVTSDDGTVLTVTQLVGDPQNPNCLLIHGFGEGMYVWSDTIAALADRYSVTAVDLRGHGGSDRSKSGCYSFDTYLADMDKIFEVLRLSRVVLIGHSLGGLLAIHLAAKQHRKKVVGVVLVDISAHGESDGSAEVLNLLKDSLRIYKTPKDYEKWLLSARPLLSNNSAQQLTRGALRECLGGFCLRVDPTLAHSHSTDDVDYGELMNLLPMIDAPTLLIRGVASAVLDARGTSKMVSRLRKGQTITVKMAGHAVMSDNPKDFNLFTRIFIDRILASNSQYVEQK